MFELSNVLKCTNLPHCVQYFSRQLRLYCSLNHLWFSHVEVRITMLVQFALNFMFSSQSIPVAAEFSLLSLLAALMGMPLYKPSLLSRKFVKRKKVQRLLNYYIPHCLKNSNISPSPCIWNLWDFPPLLYSLSSNFQQF